MQGPRFPQFVARMDELRLMPLYELLEELFTLFDMAHRETGRLSVLFLRCGDILPANNSSDLDGFIRYWDETLCNKTIPSGEMDGIRIFSIQVKDWSRRVILLRLETGERNTTNWCGAPLPRSAVQLLNLVPVNYSSTMAESVCRAGLPQRAVAVVGG